MAIWLKFIAPTTFRNPQKESEALFNFITPRGQIWLQGYQWSRPKHVDKWFAMKCCTDIHCWQRMKPTDFTTTTMGFTFVVLSEM